MINKQILQPFLDAHQGNKIFAQALESIQLAHDLLKILSRYIKFNSLFAGGVANLAGEIATRSELFRDRNEPLTEISDRSVEIGAFVLYAAVDEFGDKATRHSAPHRTLAQAVLKGVKECFYFTDEEFNELTKPNPTTVATFAEILSGYGVNRKLNDQEIFSALRFHMCSEIIAHYEFEVLISFLERRFGSLIEHLSTTPSRIGNVKHESYYWISVHREVEVKHFEKAMVACILAQGFYTGAEPEEMVQNWILDGAKSFLSVQTAFMLGLSE